MNDRPAGDSDSKKTVITELLVPEHGSEWKVVRVVVVPIASLRARLMTGPGFRYTPVRGTPHFAFIRDYHQGRTPRTEIEDTPYARYVQRYQHDYTSPEQFVRLYESLKRTGYLGGGFERKLVLAYRRPPQPHRIIFDGLHRAAVLSVLGVKRIEIGVLAHRTPVAVRLLRRLGQGLGG